MQDHTYNSLSPMQIFFRNKWVRLILFVDIVLLLTAIALLIWQSTKVSTISFNVAPIDSTIAINGNQNYQNGQYSITPGTYNVTISHEGLESKNFTVDIAPQSVATISTFLSDADHTFDFYKLKKNYSSYAKLEEIASADNNMTTDQDTSAEPFIQKFQDSYTAMNTKLPIEYSESTGYGRTLEIHKNISIQAKTDCEYTLCVQAFIVGTDSEDFIKSLMQDKGINAEDFEIEYKFY